LKRVDNGSEQMNVDGRTSGDVVTLWNGTGASDTGGDWTAGNKGNESASADSGGGTNGWATTVTSLNDVTTFDNGSMADIVGTYGELKFMMQPKAFPVDSVLRVGFLDDSNDIVGSWLNVANYVSNMDLDTWQQVSIPIEDFSLDGNVQKLRFRYRVTSGQHFWFDDLELIEIGDGPYKFRIAAPVSENWYMSMLVLQIIAPESGWNNDAFANISGGLANGLILRQRRLSIDESLWRFVTKNNREMFGQYHPQESFAFADNTLLLGFMVKPGKATVIITADDVLEFAVRDDLSSITDMRAYLHYGVEEVS